MDQEQTRLDALQREELMDTQAEDVFDSITRLAASICDTPIALFSLVDANRQWFKSAVGLEQGGQTPRDQAFCAHAIQTPGELYEVRDAHLEPAFACNPLVTGVPDLRFYAGMPVRSESGHALGTLCVIDRVPRTLSESQRRSLRELASTVECLIRERRAHREARCLLSNAYVQTPGLLYLLDASGAIVEVSDMWLALFGYDRERVIGRNARDFMSTKAREAFLAVRDRFWADGGCRDYPCQFMTSGGQAVDVLISAAIESDPSGRPVRVRCVLIDVTRQLKLQTELEQQAHIDSLTAIPNRRFFCERLETEIIRARRYARPLSMLLFDVDRFKLINDRYGHQIGDQALMQVAAITRQTIRDCDVVGRLGGEEFAVILPETNSANAFRAAERLRFVIESSAVLIDEGRSVTLTVSVGVTTFDDSTTAQEALTQADTAMYAAKRSGRNRAMTWEHAGAARVVQALSRSKWVSDGFPRMMSQQPSAGSGPAAAARAEATETLHFLCV